MAVHSTVLQAALVPGEIFPALPAAALAVLHGSTSANHRLLPSMLNSLDTSSNLSRPSSTPGSIDCSQAWLPSLALGLAAS